MTRTTASAGEREKTTREMGGINSPPHLELGGAWRRLCGSERTAVTAALGGGAARLGREMEGAEEVRGKVGSGAMPFYRKETRGRWWPAGGTGEAE